MIILFTIVVIIALLTAFFFGWVAGEDAAKWDYIVKTWEDEEDGGIEKQDPVTD